MIATASALIGATEEAILGDETMKIASFISHGRHDLDQKQFASAMFMYASAVAASAVDNATKVLLTKEQFAELMITIGELDKTTKDIIREENNGK